VFGSNWKVLVHGDTDYWVNIGLRKLCILRRRQNGYDT
jgi:hypothetical protein